jgi:hypothetical protein
MSAAEDMGIFGDIEGFDPGVDPNVMEAAAQLAAAPPQQAAPQQPQQIQQVQTAAPPPSEPVLTQEQKSMDQYNEEKQKLFELRDQLFKLAHSDKSGHIIRNFDLSQIVLKIGEEVDRLNGLVILRSLKARCKSVSRVKDSENKTQSTQVTEQEELANCMYEVWGVMEDGSVGLTSSYAPSMILCVISLQSGYDMPPED